MENLIKNKIDEMIKNNKIVLFMKGEPANPACGFSQKVVNILREMKVDFFSYDVTLNNNVKEFIKTYSQWPTFPQLYINEELIGGCDIVCEMYESGDLYDIINKTINNIKVEGE